MLPVNSVTYLPGCSQSRTVLRPKELASRTSPDLRVAGGRKRRAAAPLRIYLELRLTIIRSYASSPLQLDQPWARDAFSVTAARIRAFNASSSIFSPS